MTSPHLLVLRNAEPGDAEFLYRVYAGTRADEMALVDWTAEQKEAFVRMQFNAQRQHYQTYYPEAQYQVIQCDGGSAGRLIVDRSGPAVLIIDIALLPEYRNAGIGTSLMKDLLAEASGAGRPVVLHVETFNPAMKLYLRLGFVKTGEQGIYHEMTWTPVRAAEKAS